MSVRKGDRDENKLEVLNDLRILSEYTIQICRNEKIFPKSSRWIMAQRIVNECLEAVTCVRHANSAYVGDDFMKDRILEYRIAEQMKAHSHLDAMLSLIDIAYGTFGIEGRKIEYWTGLVLTADDRLKAWMKGDKARHGK